MIFVGYYKDMMAYMLFDIITNDAFFHRVVHFDEHFKHSLDPTLSIHCKDGANHVDFFFFNNNKMRNIKKL
jgi:hypothetical protein